MKRSTTPTSPSGERKTDEDEQDLPSDMEFEDDFDDEYEHEEIVDAQFLDEENEDEEESQQQPAIPAPSVFRPGIDELEDGQVLEPEPGTYKMLHRLDVQWPCLSFDVIPDAMGDNRTKFPMTAYVVSGTQADKADKNKLIVMKWSNLQRTNKDGLEDEEDEDEIDRKYKLLDDEDGADDDEDENNNDEDPNLEFKMIKHNGGVNRARVMPQMSTLVASWSDNGSVYVHNIFPELEGLEGRTATAAASGAKSVGYSSACVSPPKGGYRQTQ